MNVSVPDTLLYMDDFVPYSNKILMQNPGDIPWHMIELVEGDAVVLAAADTAVSMSDVDLSSGTWRDTNAMLPIAIAARESGYINFVRNAYGMADWVSSTNDGELMNDTRFTNLLKDYDGDFSDNVSDYIEDIQLAFTGIPGDYWCPMGSTYSSSTDNVWAVCSVLNLNDGICKRQTGAAFTADSGDSFALLPVELNDTPTECPSGYYGDGAICTKCPAGSYCPAGATTPTACPANSYCPEGSTASTTCPDNSTSVEGSAVYTCDAGHSVGGDKTTTTTVGAACVANTYTVTLDANGGTGCMMTAFNK